MKNIFILIAIISLAVFSSCDHHDLEDDNSLGFQETEDYGEVFFKIKNKDNTLLEKDDLLIINKSINAVSYHWDFGNGDTSTEAEPEYEYDIHGYYTVTLTITDAYGKKQSASKEILVLCLFGGGDHDS